MSPFKNDLMLILLSMVNCHSRRCHILNAILLSIAILSWVGSDLYTEAGDSHVEKYSIKCVFTGKIINPNAGYLYECCYNNKLSNFTSHYRPDAEPPYVIGMYQQCDNSTVLTNNKGKV